MELENIIFPTGSDIKSESTFSKKKYNMNKQFDYTNCYVQILRDNNFVYSKSLY